MNHVLISTRRFERDAKNLTKRRPQVRDDLQFALGLLAEDAFHPSLKTHKLKGALEGSFACSMAHDIIYIQAKRWDSVVGRPEVQKFAGALQGQRARKGVFIITSGFSREAEQYASNIETKVILIGGDRLAEFMIDHGVGVTTDATYEVKRIDADYFADE